MVLTFEEYLDSIKDNFSHNVASKEILEQTKTAFDETVYDMYYSQIPQEKAVVLMENFYCKFREFLNC